MNKPFVFTENMNNIIKKSIPLLNLLINCILARSAPQVQSIRNDCTFLFLSFLIIGFCNSSANSLFEIFSFFILLPDVFSQTIYKPLKKVPIDIPHVLEF